MRTLQRWKAHEALVVGDRRPGAERPTPAHALSIAERERILAVANEPRFADMPPARIVPMHPLCRYSRSRMALRSKPVTMR